MFIIFLALFITACSARNAFPDKTDDAFQNECLATSNQHRAKHHAPAFHIDQAAVAYAKSRCQLISQFEELSHGHAGLKGYGENQYWGGNSADAVGGCKTAIDSWYNEVSHYHYDKPGFSTSTGHFTQLVWKSTTGVGCARCYGKGAKWFETYVVCNYKPAGNLIGAEHFKKNVLKA